MVVSNLIVRNFYAEALFCALLRAFAPFCALSKFALFCGLAFAHFCAHLALFCVFFCVFCVQRLERPRLGTSESCFAKWLQFSDGHVWKERLPLP